MVSHLPHGTCASLGEVLSPKTLYIKLLEVRIIEKQVKRTRPYFCSFRVSEVERELIEGKVKTSGLSKTDFLIKALSDKPIVCIDNSAEILNELKRQGNNLNQAVKNCYFGATTEQELLSAVEKCKEVYKAILFAVGKS